VSLICALALLSAPEASEHHAAFEVSGFRAVIGDNAPLGEHRQHYNGVFSLHAPGLEESPFVPLYSGLNLEHYFDARPRSPEAAIFFEPRHAPMHFSKVDAHTAELHQPETPYYGVESWTTFTLREPHYLDMDFRCIPRKDVFEGGFMGVFWASYINAPHDKGIYFPLAGSTLDAPVWGQLVTQQHGLHSSVLHENDTLDIAFEATGDVLYANLSPLRYSVPFYYGRWRDQVLIFIFKPGPNVRFAHSPSGGGRTPEGAAHNPAWDFQLIVPDYEVGEEYRLEMRLVYKPWEGREDVLEEVRGYLLGAGARE